jgi:hypothetical protein
MIKPCWCTLEPFYRVDLAAEKYISLSSLSLSFSMFSLFLSLPIRTKDCANGEPWDPGLWVDCEEKKPRPEASEYLHTNVQSIVLRMLAFKRY